MTKFLFSTFLIAILGLSLFSCASRKTVSYYQNIDVLDASAGSQFETTLQPDDLLMIVVMGENAEVVAPFNLPTTILQGTSELVNNAQRMATYLIDRDGFIQFPILGSVQLGGLSRTEASAKLNALLSKYITNPSVNLRILNFKVTVQGEVARPGTHSIPTERITLAEALSLSGDLTIYGQRQNILVVREENGKKTASRVDITQADFINSPYYYLSQNDLVYVEPNRTKVNSSVVGPNTSIIISAISLLITVIALAIR